MTSRHIILLLIFATFFSNAQTLKQGDNIQTEFKKIGTPYYFKAPSFTGWTEGSDMLLIGSKANPNDCDIVFLALQDTTLIGVFKPKAPSTFMFDVEDNSVLGEPSDCFLLPLWIVKKRTRLVSADKKVLMLFDKMYEKTMQANEMELDESTINEYRQYQTDPNLANRHIALLFDNYQTIITQTSRRAKRRPLIFVSL
jgi:hypothetical protein